MRKMRNLGRLLDKAPAIIFAALFLLFGYDFVTSFSYYNSRRYTRTDDFTWISVFLTAAVGRYSAKCSENIRYRLQ